MDLNIRDGENELQYIWRTSEYVRDGKITWKGLTDEINARWRDPVGEPHRGESCYRKSLNAGRAYKANVFDKMNGDTYANTLDEKRRELEKERIQLRDERNEWNKQNRLAARTERNLDYLGNLLKNIGRVNFKSKKPVDVSGDNDLLICVSDTHLGEDNCNYFGYYDSEIAKQRLDKYLQEIIDIQSRHSSENATVALLGDLISGNIHLSIQVGNREKLIDQIKIVSELLTSFIHELSAHFKTVNVCSVSGNHSRISKKDDALKDDRLDDLIFFIMQKSLSHLINVDFREYDSLDTSIACTEIRGKEYILVHGDYDQPTESGVMRLCTMVGILPEAIVMGHRHSPAYSEINGIKVVQSGCLSGSGGDYCIQKRLTGEPSQMVCVCDSKGVQTFYPIKLY